MAHELGHRHHLDDRQARTVLRTREALATRVAEGALLPRLLGRRLLGRTQPLSFGFEHECDTKAAEVVGSEVMGSALEQVEVLGAVFYGTAARWAEQLEEDGKRPVDLLEAFDVAVADPLVRERALADGPDLGPVESHPPRLQRLAALGTYPAGPYADRPVSVRDPEGLRRRFVEVLVDQTLQPIRILDDPEQVATSEEDAREVVQDITGATSLDDLLRLLDERPLELPELPRDALVGASARLLSDQLQHRGWTKASPWLSSWLVAPDGSRHDLRALMEQALNSLEVRAEVRRMVAS